jgi:hypothetical protein
MTYQEQVRQGIAALIEIRNEEEVQIQRLVKVLDRIHDDELNRAIAAVVNSASHTIEIAAHLLEVAIANLPEKKA